MPSRASWPSGISTGILAASSFAVVVLIWTISSAEEKRRKSRRRNGDDDEDESSCNNAGADGILSLKEQASALECSRTVSDVRFDKSISSNLPLGVGGNGSPWSVPRSANTSPWLSGVSGYSPPRAPMSPNEKRELDLMFRHQERQDARGPAVVDAARSKQSARRRRRVVPSAPVRAYDTVDAEDEYLAEKFAEELLAEEEASQLELPVSPKSPGQVKKTKQKKSRKRNKTRDAENHIATQQCEGMEHETLEIEIDELADDQCLEVDEVETECAPISEIILADGDSVSDEDATSQTAMPDCAIEEPSVAVTEEPASSVTSSTRQSSYTFSTKQDSEVGDCSKQDSEVGDGETELLEESTAAAVDVIESKTEDTTNSCDHIQSYDNHHTVPDSPCEDRTQRPSSVLGSQRRSQRSWADVTDTSDEESMSVWYPQESRGHQFTGGREVANATAGAHLLKILRGEASSDIPQDGREEVTTVDNISKPLEGRETLVDDIAMVDVDNTADKRAISAEAVELDQAKVDNIPTDSAQTLATGARTRPGWVMVQTRQTKKDRDRRIATSRS